jgi:uncharacterized protein YuzE
MTPPKFRLEVSYSDAGDPVAAYVRVREGKIAKTTEICDGVAFADYGADGFLLGIELLAPCRVELLESIAAQEPGPVQEFLRRGVRKEMIQA